MNWLITIVLFLIVGIVLDREIYFYEGAHLGPRLQAWLYDRWSKNYDEGKRSSQLHDDEMLARPLLEVLNARRVSEPFILDFATGTGRLSHSLVNRGEFKGSLIALDLSQGMLEQAAAKLKPASAVRQNVEFLRHRSLPLPFPDAAFDAVCALEVLEHFPNMDTPLAELSRVLRPGGILLTSRGTEESGRKAMIKTTSEFLSLLEKNGWQQIQITPWWKFYDRVLAVKHGSSQPVTAKRLSEVLTCSSCKAIDWERRSSALKCQTCEKELFITQEEIVLNEA